MTPRPRGRARLAGAVGWLALLVAAAWALADRRGPAPARHEDRPAATLPVVGSSATSEPGAAGWTAAAVRAPSTAPSTADASAQSSPTPDPWAAWRPVADASYPVDAAPLADAPPVLATARMFVALGRPETARATLEPLEAAPGPAAAGAAVALAGLDLGSGDPGSALERLWGGPAGRAGPVLPAEGLYRLAGALEAIGEPRAAARAYEAFGDSLPAMMAAAQMARGNASMDAGEYDAAETAYSVAVEAQRVGGATGGFLAALRRGNATLRTDPTRSIAAYEAAYELAQSDSQRAQALDGQIAAHVASDRVDLANEVRLRIVRDLPGSDLAGAALARLDEASIEPGGLLRARVLSAAGKHAAAVEVLQALEAAAGLDAAGRLELARAHDGMGDAASALRQLELVPEALAAPAGASRPSAADAAVGVEAAWLQGTILARLDRDTEAADAWLRLADTWPESARAGDALRRRAAALLHAEGPLAASAALDLLLERRPQDEEAPDDAFRAAFLLWRAGRATQAAWRLERLAEAADPPAALARAYYWLGRLASDGGRAEAAAEQWARAVAADPSGYYGVRAGQRLGIGWPAPQESPAGDAAMQAWLTELGTGGGTDSRDAEASRPASLERAAAWLALCERPAALAELAAARRAAHDDPAALWRIAARARDLGIVEAQAGAAERVLALAPAEEREAAPAALWRMAWPAGHDAEVRALAASEALEPALLWAVIRQESRFEPTARSSAGAIGLTQVMPETGRHIAEMLGEPFDAASLVLPEVALRYGAWYLGRQMERYGGREWAALAAYNGGPGNADRWLAASGDDRDTFVETVDFAETRLYLQRTLVHLQRYRWLYPDAR